MTDWREIEAAAREQVLADLDVAESTPLMFGEYIAWVTFRFGRTDDLSPIHRVGFPQGDTPYTTCGELIPVPLAWMILTPALIRTMPPCRFCEAEYARAQKEIAA